MTKTKRPTFEDWWSNHPKRRDKGMLKTSTLDGFDIYIERRQRPDARRSGSTLETIRDVSKETILEIIAEARKHGIVEPT